MGIDRKSNYFISVPLNSDFGLRVVRSVVCRFCHLMSTCCEEFSLVERGSV